MPYVANEVFPFIDSQCRTPGIPIATLGASLGAFDAANTLSSPSRFDMNRHSDGAPSSVRLL